MEDWIEQFARKSTEKIIGNMQLEALALCQQSGGTLGALFGLERKSELKKFCKRTEVPKKEFSQTIIACEMGLLPWRHEISHRNFVPDHLHPTDDEMAAVAGARPGAPLPKALKKIASQFEERRMLVGHMFYNDDLSRWHLLYFDQRDTDPHQNHWEAGSHMHLINWVTHPRENANEAWQRFHNGNPKMRGTLHLKCAFD